MINPDDLLNKWLLSCDPVTSKYEYYHFKKIDGIHNDEQGQYWYWGLKKEYSFEPTKIVLGRDYFHQFDFVPDDAAKYLDDTFPCELLEMYKELRDSCTIPSIPDFINLCIKYDLSISSSALGGKILSLDGDYLKVKEYTYLGSPTPYANTGIVNINSLTYIAAMYNSVHKQRADAYDRVQSLNSILKDC